MKKILLLLTALPLLAFAEPQKLTLVLDWYPNPNHAPILIAQAMGYYQNNNIDLDIQTPTDPSAATKLVVAKKADIGVSYQPKLAFQTQQGMPIEQIGTLVATPLDCFIVAGEHQSVKDLKGKTIGFSDSGTGHFMLSTVLADAGLTLSDVKLVNVHYSLSQALLTHKVDAVTGMMRNSELPLLKQHHEPVSVIYPEEHGVPFYSELIFIANPSNKHPEANKAFLDATQKGVNYIVNHPDDAWELYVKLYPSQNTTLNHEIWVQTLPRFALRPEVVDSERLHQFTALNDKQDTE